jgi:hypothetical protein
VPRGLAGLFFFIAAILLAVAAGGWWLQRVAFSPAASRDVAREIFEIDSIQQEFVTLVSTGTAERLGLPATDVEQELTRNLSALLADETAREVLADVVSDAHARMIGERTEPVTITGQQMVPLVRTQTVFDVPTVTLPVEKIGFLSTIRTSLSWVIPIAAIAGFAALVLGVLAHPRRADAIFGIGVFCIIAAVLTMLFGYAVPAFVLPLLNDDGWVDVIPAIANEQLAFVSGLSVVLAVVGAVLVFGSLGARRRKSRGGSTPMRVNRYRGEQRRWS